MERTTCYFSYKNLISFTKSKLGRKRKSQFYFISVSKVLNIGKLLEKEAKRKQAIALRIKLITNNLTKINNNGLQGSVRHPHLLDRIRRTKQFLSDLIVLRLSLP